MAETVVAVVGTLDTERAALVAERDRGRSMGVLASGAAMIVARLYREGRIHRIAGPDTTKLADGVGFEPTRQ
ncbi:MAG TPA: hypothetical protein VFK86_08390, partial [Bauldia sp.]|nr:hypothetical protein [Bauldia sp.]